MTVESGYGAYLKAPARYVTARIAGNAAAWGDKAVSSTVLSPITTKEQAQAEAIAQAQFLAGPIARDRHVIPGHRRDLIGQIVTLTINRLGYDAGANVFVIGVAENANGTSTLTVLKRQ